MSEAMIVRRGGGSKGGGGFDQTGAVLKVVTSAGCIVDISATGYTATQIDSDGFPRIGNPDVVEHFFNIPATAFGTVTVMATNDYGMNTKTLTVNEAGKVYEQLCGGINIILDSTFGLQSGLEIMSSEATYSDRYKNITFSSDVNFGEVLFENIPVQAFSNLTVASTSRRSYDAEIALRDQDNVVLCRVQTSGSSVTVPINDKYYPTANLVVGWPRAITEIVLS